MPADIVLGIFILVNVLYWVGSFAVEVTEYHKLSKPYIGLLILNTVMLGYLWCQLKS